MLRNHFIELKETLKYIILFSGPRQLEEPCQDQHLAKVAAALKVGFKGTGGEISSSLYSIHTSVYLKP